MSHDKCTLQRMGERGPEGQVQVNLTCSERMQGVEDREGGQLGLLIQSPVPNMYMIANQLLLPILKT